MVSDFEERHIAPPDKSGRLSWLDSIAGSNERKSALVLHRRRGLLQASQLPKREPILLQRRGSGHRGYMVVSRAVAAVPIPFCLPSLQLTIRGRVLRCWFRPSNAYSRSNGVNDLLPLL